ncbi:MAG: FAD-dependent oxidoreductase [Cyanobacteria bacterium J06639_1]
MAVRRAIVIGAGIAGLVCARRLHEAGCQVQMLDKSRGLGGRVATRRVTLDGAEPPIRVDHGTQYISPKSEDFQNLVREWLDAGVVEEWTRSLHVLDDTGLHSDGKSTPRYVCPDGMSAIAKHLARDLDILTHARVTSLRRRGTGWVVRAEGDREFEADIAIVAIPAPQAVEMLQSAIKAEEISKGDPAIAALQKVRYTPCIAVMAGYAATVAPPDWKGIAWMDDEAIAWMASDSSKRSSSSAPAIVVHSTADFARGCLDASREELEAIGAQLLARAAQRLGGWLKSPDWMQVHRWRYALSATRSDETSWAIADGSLVLTGDWCVGARVESAYVSGLDAAERVLKAIA